MEAGRKFEARNKAMLGSYASRESGYTHNNKPRTNVHEAERMASAIGGGALTIFGITKGGISGLALALLGECLA